jgi:hypothetical protein
MPKKLQEELPHDLWGISKSITPMSPEDTLEAWRKTVAILEALCPVADALGLEPLLLALTDATYRADEEAERARDRVERPEGVQVSPRERERLDTMLMRSNALSNAIAVRVNHDNPERLGYAEEMAILEEMRREADEALERYKLEIGFSFRK